MRNLVRLTEGYCSMVPNLTCLTFAGADTSYRFDLDENLGCRKASDFNQCRAGKISTKELLSGAPHFGVVLDVDDVNGHFHDVRHGPSRGLHKVSDLAKDQFCLLVFIPALDRPTVTAASNHAGDEKHIADAQSIGPAARWRFRNVRAGNSFDLHGLSPLDILLIGRSANFVRFAIPTVSKTFVRCVSVWIGFACCCPLLAGYSVLSPSRSMRSDGLKGVCSGAITSLASICTRSTCVSFGP